MSPKIIQFFKNSSPAIIVIVICLAFYVFSTIMYKKDVDELQRKMALVEKQNITSIVDRASLNVKADMITDLQKDKLNRIMDALERIEEKVNKLER